LREREAARCAASPREAGIFGFVATGCAQNDATSARQAGSPATAALAQNAIAC
jgi:hypothetical protein